MPTGKLDVVIFGAVGLAALTVMLRFVVALSGVLSESSTSTVKLAVPAVVGVPEMTPVLDVSDSPAGKVPELTLHV